MLHFLRKITPKILKKYYHFCLAKAAVILFRNPSKKIIVIGVTGTSGKSTVVYLLARLLELSGFKAGAASTLFFKVGKIEKVNNKKMTMLGRFALQRMISQMVKANCQYAVIETSSQGIEQFRHLGINYDVLIFTNLYPEHIEAHGGFDNYKRAKLKLFEKLKKEESKNISGQKVAKTIIVNMDDEHASDFLHPWAEKKIGYTALGVKNFETELCAASDIKLNDKGIVFKVNNQIFSLPIYGSHNVYNALAVIACARHFGLSEEAIARNLQKIENIPGRIEFIDEGQPFKVIVDYAFEPKAVLALYEVAKLLNPDRIIHVLGSAGGGRDISRREPLGELAGKFAEYVIVTNEDPYDEDPKTIIEQVAKGAAGAGKVENKNLFMIEDRKKAIAKAFALAKPNDLVLITGKGSEQAIVTRNNRLLPWDDRVVARELLNH